MEKSGQSQIEFVGLMAALMSIAALALDALLPALDVIGVAVGNYDPVRNQLLITLFFLGLGTGPLLFGPISDSIGRKPVVYWGFALFILASYLCVAAQSFEMMVAGRVLQGVAPGRAKNHWDRHDTRLLRRRLYGADNFLCYGSFYTGTHNCTCPGEGYF